MTFFDRKNIHLLDVTLRDGGYVYSFSDHDALQIVKSLNDSGINLVEIGYFRRKSKEYFGYTGAYVCDKTYLQKISRVKKNGLVLMVRPDDNNIEDYDELRDTSVQLVRFPVSPHQFEKIKLHIAAIKDMGIKVALNITRVSERTLDEIVNLGKKSEDLGVDILYIADSNGSCFPEQITKIFDVLRNKLTVNLGFHPHDGLSLAFANTLAALRSGATLIDASLGGMGKGGNLSTELISIYLNLHYKENINIRRLFTLSSKYILPLLGESCIIKNENAVASILNLNLDQLSELKTIAKESSKPMWEILVKKLTDTCIQPYGIATTSP